MKVVKHGKERSKPMTPGSRAPSPFWPLNRLQENMDQFFEAPFSSWLAPTEDLFEAWVPTLDVYEDKEKVYVKVELPGMKREEIEVYFSGEMLNIAGERKEETEHKSAEAYRSERYFGRFHRSLALPAAVEANKIEAHYKDGVLTVICPKTEEAKRKEVEIKVE